MNKKNAKRNVCLRLISLLLFALALIMILDFFMPVILKRIYRTSYSEIVEMCSENYNIPKEIIFAVIYTESKFKPDAVSSRGASGLMQLMPDTFDWLYKKLPDEIKIDDGSYTDTDIDMGADMLDKADIDTAKLKVKDDIFDPETNIVCGTYLLCILYREFQDWDTVFAAYNAGMGRVRGWLCDERYSKDGKLIDIPFEETSEYVVRVNRAADNYKKIYDL